MGNGFFHRVFSGLNQQNANFFFFHHKNSFAFDHSGDWIGRNIRRKGRYRSHFGVRENVRGSIRGNADGCLQRYRGKLTVEQVIGRSAAVAVPAVPEVKSQTGKAFGPAGLPAVTDTFGPDAVLLEIKDFLDVAPGIITGPIR